MLDLSEEHSASFVKTMWRLEDNWDHIRLHWIELIPIDAFERTQEWDNTCSIDSKTICNRILCTRCRCLNSRTDLNSSIHCFHCSFQRLSVIQFGWHPSRWHSCPSHSWAAKKWLFCPVLKKSYSETGPQSRVVLIYVALVCMRPSSWHWPPTASTFTNIETFKISTCLFQRTSKLLDVSGYIYDRKVVWKKIKVTI